MSKDIEYRPTPYPLFKGATRKATFLGVPTTPLLAVVILVGVLAITISLAVWLIMPVIIFIMAQITRHDDKAFRIWWLWFETKGRNRNKVFWGASSYTPSDYRRSHRMAKRR